jgi:hypothetical protein
MAQLTDVKAKKIAPGDKPVVEGAIAGLGSTWLLICCRINRASASVQRINRRCLGAKFPPSSS